MLNWLQKPTVVALAVAAAVVVLAGMLTFQLGAPDAVAEPSSQAVAPDAVQQVLLRAGKPTIIEFGANSCASCREMKPVLHALSQDPRLVVADVDILKERDYISRYQIRLMPTQVFYNAQGEETGRHMGKISAEDILAQLGLAPANTATGAALPKAAL
ncbi:MAG: thioredoxin family protein [Rhodoferax sp.]